MASFSAGLLTLLAIFSLIFVARETEDKIGEIEINGKKIKVEIARTPTSHYQGLSNRKGLCPNCGMFFIFPIAGERTFVMRDMLFPIDIIWINNEKIIKIEKNLQPADPMFPEGYSSDSPVNFVLEVSGGFCQENNIKVGDKIKYLDI